MISQTTTRDAKGDTRWLVFFCIARIGFSFIFTSYSAAMPLLTRDWAMSATQAGMVQSAWHLGFLVSLFGVGILGDRYGAKRVFLWSAAAASASALLFALFSSGFRSGALLYGFAGLCSGGSYTPGLALIAERFGPASRGRAMGAYLAAGSLGYAISILVSSQLFPLGGWRLAFVVTGSLPAVGLALSLWTLGDTPNRIHARSADLGIRKAIPAVLKNRPALLSMLAYTFHCWELLGLWAWLPAYLAQAAQAAGGGGAAVQRAVLLSGLTYLTSMAGSLIGGALSDRWGRSLSMLFFSCISLVFSFTFGWMLGWPLALLFAAAASYNLAGIADSSIYSTALSELVDPRQIGAAYAVRSVMGFGAGVVSPWVFGLVIDLARAAPLSSERLAWGLAWTCLGVGALPGPLMIWRLRKRPEALRMGQGRR